MCEVAEDHIQKKKVQLCTRLKKKPFLQNFCLVLSFRVSKLLRSQSLMLTLTISMYYICSIPTGMYRDVITAILLLLCIQAQIVIAFNTIANNEFYQSLCIISRCTPPENFPLMEICTNKII